MIQCVKGLDQVNEGEKVGQVVVVPGMECGLECEQSILSNQPLVMIQTGISLHVS